VARGSARRTAASEAGPAAGLNARRPCASKVG
jgi:hypothetical protein